MDDLEHVFEGERLEVELVRDIEVSGDGLGVRVDHDGFVATLAQREDGAHTAVVKLHPLSDAIGPRPKDDDLLAPFGGGLALLVVAAVEVRGTGGKLAGTRIDHLVGRPHGERPAERAGFVFGDAAQCAELAIGESEAFHATHAVCIDHGLVLVLGLGDNQLVQLVEEPRIDAGDLVQLRSTHPQQHGALELVNALRRGAAQCATELLLRAFDESVINEPFADGPSATASLECA